MPQSYSKIINDIRYQMLYRNCLAGSIFYAILIFLLMATRDNPLGSVWHWSWLVTCLVICVIRTGLANSQSKGEISSPSPTFIALTLTITICICTIVLFPTGYLKEGPIIVLLGFVLVSLAVSVVFHAFPKIVLANNLIVFGTLTAYYLTKRNVFLGAESVHWLTMIFFPCIFAFNMMLSKAMRNTGQQTIRMIKELERSNQRISDQAEELKRLADEKQKIAEKAEAASQSKSAFLANISHEIRTPLNSVIGFSQILEADSRMPDHSRDNLKRINNSGQHLLLLINDVLDMSKIEADRLELDPEPTHLRGLMETIHDLMHNRAADRGLQLKLEIDSDVPDYIEVDPLKLRQVMLNLVSNAIKFTSSGSVTIIAQYDSTHGNFTLGVRDTGRGIKESELIKLFRPFEQSEDNLSDEGGTGLGLSISSSIVELMGGVIQVESQHGEGSYFF
ncbi:MAG: ATP-binding protein, partial [Verrucomicrobiota bacterium]